MSLQPDQEAFAVDANEAHLFPGPAAARGGNTPESGEEGIGARSGWRGCDRHCFDPPLQPLPTYHICLDCSVTARMSSIFLFPFGYLH